MPLLEGAVAVPRASFSDPMAQGLSLVGHGTRAYVDLELAGHADLTTTQRYMHLSPAATEDAVRLLDERAVGTTALTPVATCWQRDRSSL